MAKATTVLRKILSLLIVCYRYLISPILGNHCRFYPSCSVYAQEAIEQYGIWRGLILTSKRLACCHPWHTGGHDPVPSNKTLNN